MKIEIEQKGSKTIVLRLFDDIDIVTIGQLKKTTYDLLKEKGSKLLIDLSSVNYLDSLAFGLFFGLIRRAQMVQGSIRLFGVRDEVKKIMYTTGIVKLIPLLETQEQAIASLTSKIQLEKTGKNVRIFVIYGDVDEAVIEDIEERVSRLLKEEKQYLVLDFSHVEYVDSRGLGLLVVMTRKLQKKEGDVYLCNVSADIKKMFHYTEVDKIISICDTRESAESLIPS